MVVFFCASGDFWRALSIGWIWQNSGASPNQVVALFVRQQRNGVRASLAQPISAHTKIHRLTAWQSQRDNGRLDHNVMPRLVRPTEEEQASSPVQHRHSVYRYEGSGKEKGNLPSARGVGTGDAHKAQHHQKRWHRYTPITMHFTPFSMRFRTLPNVSRGGVTLRLTVSIFGQGRASACRCVLGSHRCRTARFALSWTVRGSFRGGRQNLASRTRLESSGTSTCSAPSQR